jgi:hypothetical protein
MVWVNPPNRWHYNFVWRIPQSSTPGMPKMFNHHVDLLSRKSLFFLFLLLLLDTKEHDQEQE